MEDHEEKATVIVDEIHLQPYFDDKGGTITGAATTSADTAKTAHIFMVQRLLSSSSRAHPSSAEN